MGYRSGTRREQEALGRAKHWREVENRKPPRWNLEERPVEIEIEEYEEHYNKKDRRDNFKIGFYFGLAVVRDNFKIGFYFGLAVVAAVLVIMYL